MSSAVRRSPVSFSSMSRSALRFMTTVTVQKRSLCFSKNLKGSLRGDATSPKRIGYWLAFAEDLGLCVDPVHCIPQAD